MKYLRPVLFVMAALSLIAWVLGTFVFHTGFFIHIFLMLGAIFYMQGLIVCPKPQQPLDFV
jgi:hypothetical protein